MTREYLHKLCEILLHGRLISSPFIYSLYHLFTSVGTHEYLLCVLGYNILLYLFCSSFAPVLATVPGFSQLLFLFDKLLSILCRRIEGCHFLLSDAERCPRLILYIFCPSAMIRHFSKEPWFILLENGFRSKNLGASSLLLLQCHCF